MKVLIILALAFVGMSFLAPQQSPKHGGLRKSDDAETVPGTGSFEPGANFTPEGLLLAEGAVLPDGTVLTYRVPGVNVPATSGSRPTLKASWVCDGSSECTGGEKVSVEWEPPATMNRKGAIRFFNDEVRLMKESHPVKPTTP